MRCSSCSADVKPVVAWDVDGTMADYHETFPAFACRHWDVPIPADKYDGSCDIEEWLGLTKDQHREAKLAYRQSGLKRSLPAYPYAAYAVNAMRREGVEIWVATTRPWQLLSNIDPDTREWLRRNDIPHDGLLYGDDKYDRLAESIDPDRILMVIEDLAPLIDRATELGMFAYQVHRPHNEGLGCRRAGGDLPTALMTFHDRLDEWRTKHGCA